MIPLPPRSTRTDTPCPYTTLCRAPLVGQTALKEAIELARQTGVGVVFARGSNHFGPISPYAFLAAQQGFASFICSNATTTIAPWGGREARLGRSEEHTSELQSLMRISYAVFCLKKTIKNTHNEL